MAASLAMREQTASAVQPDADYLPFPAAPSKPSYCPPVGGVDAHACVFGPLARFPFARVLVQSFPDRVLWGSDWPHPNLRSHRPDEGALVDTIPRIAPTEALQDALLVDNPQRLYWPEKVSS